MSTRTRNDSATFRRVFDAIHPLAQRNTALCYHIVTEAEKAAFKERIAAWKRAAPVLQEVRDADIRAADTASALQAFSGLAVLAARECPPGPSSGLVEQQRWFMKLRRR